jgi:tetratricopeptide (TPR) repeat protein
MGWSKRLVLLCLLALSTPLVAHAQDLRTQAKERYQAGEAKFRAGDYRGAIDEFRTADRILPSPMNSTNIALSYERLGDKEQAVAAYREYLVRRPDAPNRAEVEAKIAALEQQQPPPGMTPERRPYDPRLAARLPDPTAPPPTAGPEPSPQNPPYQAPEPQPQPKSGKAFYKHWAFWVVVGVGAIILIDIAVGNNDDGDDPQPTSMGPVLFRF